MRIARVLGVVAVAATLAPPLGAQAPESPPARYPAAARPALAHPPAVRGTVAPVGRPTRAGLASPPAGPPAAEPVPPTPLWFDQNPRLIRADHAGGLSLDNFLVAGDVATLTFERNSVVAADYIVRETWRRTGTTDIDGHLVSVFNPGWNGAALWDSIGWQRRGFDHPWVVFGTLLVPRPAEAAATTAGDDVARFFVRLRVAPLNVPPARVRRIDAETQYASHVVNLVMPRFGEGRLSAGDYGHRLDDAAKRFYAHFRDEYASIAFVPRQQHVVPYDAFHHNVRNPIAGLGLPVFDDTEAYGSAGVLRSVEFYPDVSFTSNASSTHAISHQWVDYWDWSTIAGGLDRAGRNPASHMPLIFPGEVYAGAALDVTRRVEAVGGAAGYAVARTPGPAMLHPTTRYRMGLIGPEAVPELLVFENQGQFDETDSAAPAVGTAVEGGWRRVHVNDILAAHGARRGPVDDAWSRVTVVVSRDGLLSAEEMSYWNFFAARHAATGGTTTWDGVPSFFEATGGAVPLRTDVTPLRAAKLVETFGTGDMPIARDEFRGVRLDAPVPARIVAGESVTIAGAVTATARDDFNFACTFWYVPGGRAHAFPCGSITGDRFSIPYRFAAADAGRYTLQMFLIYPIPGSRYNGHVFLSAISGIAVVARGSP